MRILIVSSNKESLSALSLILRELNGVTLSKALSSSEARQKILDEEFDLIVINYPLSFDSAFSLSYMARSEMKVESLFLMREEDRATVGMKLEEDGFLIVTKPILKPVLFGTIRLLENLKTRERFFEEKIRKLEDKLDEVKFLSQAKCLLIEKEGLTEQEAHKKIENFAMDNRIRLKKAAMIFINKLRGNYE